MPKIIVQKDTEIVKTYNLPGKDIITIGSSSGCDVPIEDPVVAAEQAKLVLKDDGFHLQLVTHIPPVFVTGERVEGDVKLEDGDTVRIEEYNLILNILEGEVKVVEEVPPPPPPEPKPEPPPPPEPKPETAAPEPVAQKKDVIQDAINDVLKEKEKLSESDKIRLAEEERARQEAEVKQQPGQESKPAPPPPPKPAPPEKENISVVKTQEIQIEPAEPEPPPPPPKPEPKPKPPPPKPEPKPEPPPPKPEPKPEPEPEPPPAPEPEPEPSGQGDDRKTKVLPQMDSAPEAQSAPQAPPQQRKKDKYLLAVSGPHKGEQFKLKEAANSIGRDRQKNDIVIRLQSDGCVDKSISRQHAMVEYREGRFFLSDKNSQMRTKLNGRTLSTNDILPLGVGDLVEICSIKEGTIFRFAEEGRLDFSPPDAERRPSVAGNKNMIPFIIIGAAIVVVVIILILLLK